MNLGAKVPGPGDPCRGDEVEDGRDTELRAAIPGSAREFVRACEEPMGLESGDCMIADFDRACPGGGPGDGDALFLPKGLLRHRGPAGACEVMVLLLFQACDLILPCGDEVDSKRHRGVDVKNGRVRRRKKATKCMYNGD